MVSGKSTNGWYSWVVVFAAFTVYFLIDGVLFSFGVLLVEILEEFEEPVATSAALGGIFLGFTALSSPIAGSISDAFGRRIVSLVGATLFSCGLFTSAFAPSITWLYLTYGILGGIGFGLMNTPAVASAIEHVNAEKRGVATGIAFCGAGVGLFVMSQVTSYLLDAFALRGTFLVLSSIMLNGIPCGLIFRKPQDASDEKGTVERSKPLTIVNAQSLTQKLKCIIIDTLLKKNASIFRDFQCLVVLLSPWFYGLAFFIPFSFLPEQVVGMGIGKNMAAWITSAMGLSNTLGRLCAGWLCNRSFISLTFLLKFLLLLNAILLPVSLLLTSFETKMVFACCHGWLYGAYTVTVPLALAEQVSVEKVGKAMGLFAFMILGANLVGSPIVGRSNTCIEEVGKAMGLFAFMILGADLVGSPIVGWTIDVTGDYKVGYILAGSETLIAFLILMLPQLRDVCGRTKPVVYHTETTVL